MVVYRHSSDSESDSANMVIRVIVIVKCRKDTRIHFIPAAEGERGFPERRGEVRQRRFADR